MSNLETLNGYLDDYSTLPIIDSIEVKDKIDMSNIPKNRRLFVPGPKDPRNASIENQYRASLTFYTCHNTVNLYDLKFRIFLNVLL